MFRDVVDGHGLVRYFKKEMSARLTAIYNLKFLSMSAFLILNRMQNAPICLATESLLLHSDASGILSFVWFIYTLLCSISKGIPPRVSFNGPYAE